jgi:hypothetical protein
MTRFTIGGLYEPESYKSFLEFIFSRAASCSMVVRARVPLSEAGQTYLHQLEPDLVRVATVTEWPGTRLLTSEATLYAYRVSPNFRQHFVNAAAELGAWINPDLPEDPAFYRDDDTVLFGSIVHERDAFAELTQVEAAALEELVGGENVSRS